MVEPEQYTPQHVKVSAYPNPYTDKVRFTIKSTVSGQGSLDVFNMSTAGCTSSGSATVAPSQPCLTYCSYTQGFWGNKNGLKMLPALLTTSMTLGRSGHSFTIPANSATMLLKQFLVFGFLFLVR